jgi:hypothetical protein
VTRRGSALFRRLPRLWESCRRTALAALGRRRGSASPPAEPAAEPRPPDYDAVLDRVFSVVLWHGRHLRGQEAQAREILARFEREAELDVLENLGSHIGMYARYRALLERSWALRFDDPARMVQLALFAAACARQLNPRRYGSRRVFDFRCEAEAAAGNALRVAQRLAAAACAMVRARELFELGTRSELLEVHLLDLEASLDAARRRFNEAIAGLEIVYRYHCQHGDYHLAGRALLRQAFYTGDAGDPVKALELLQRSLTLIEPSRDPVLAYTALQNQIWILCDCGRFREAEIQLFQLRPQQRHQGGRIPRLKLRWAEGRIDAGLGRLERAELTLLEVRKGLAAVPRHYDAALAALDLAAVLMGRGKSRQASEVVTDAYQTFIELRIEREALVSLLVLRNAFELGLATRAMVEKVAAFLRKVEGDPEAKFERQAWDGE